MRRVFISYVREDQDAVNALVVELRRHHVHSWIDRESLYPGQRWRDAIRKAIADGVLFVACFSRNYENKVRSYMNEELTLAVEELRRRPTNNAWFVPVVLDRLESVPDRSIGAGETLRDFQCVDLSMHPSTVEWVKGVRRIAALIDGFNDQLKPSPEPDGTRAIRVAIQGRAEDDLLGVLRASVHSTIDAALEAFVDDKDEKRYDYLMRPLCEIHGGQFTADQVVKLVTRGQEGTHSRTGFHGLCVLYDLHFDHMKSLNLHIYFKRDIEISYFLKLRERYPGWELMEIVRKASPQDLQIDGVCVNQKYFDDKFMNRGESAFLDAVWAAEEPKP